MEKLERLPTIPAARVALRELAEADADALFAVFSDPDVMRYWSSPPMQERAEAERIVEQSQSGFAAGTALQWGVERLSDGRIMGKCALHAIDQSNRRAELGYALGTAYQGQGYMNEALNALLTYAFGEMNLHRVEADIDPRNTASARTLERLGFQREGFLRERWIVSGEISDSALYGLLRHEWKSTQ